MATISFPSENTFLAQKSLNEKLSLIVQEYAGVLKSEPGATAQTALDKLVFRLNNTTERFSSVLILKFLEQLIGPGIFQIQLDSITDIFKNEKEFAEEVMKLVSTQATDISILTIRGNKGEYCFHPELIGIKMLNNIQGMSTLEWLEVDKYKFSLDNLAQICSNLKNLKHLDCIIHHQNELRLSVEMLKEAFGHLRFFYFSFDAEPSDKTYHHLKRLCVQHLPNLQKIGDPTVFTDLTVACQLQEDESQLQSIGVLLDSAKQLETSAFAMFPHVRHLCIKWDDIESNSPILAFNVASLLSFPSLMSLQFADLKSFGLVEFLFFHYGFQLEVLNVRMGFGTPYHVKRVRFSTIAQRCPKLRELSMTNISNPTDDTIRCFVNFKHLTTLRLHANQSDNDVPVRLSYILMAPNLKHVTLSGFYVSDEELQITTEMIQNGSILRKIAQLTIIVNAKFIENEVAYASAGSLLKEIMREFRPSACFKFGTFCTVFNMILFY